jgi:negative regulator of genetic competence, sporulation and motility
MYHHIDKDLQKCYIFSFSIYQDLIGIANKSTIFSFSTIYKMQGSHYFDIRGRSETTGRSGESTGRSQNIDVT